MYISVKKNLQFFDTGKNRLKLIQSRFSHEIIKMMKNTLKNRKFSNSKNLFWWSQETFRAYFSTPERFGNALKPVFHDRFPDSFSFDLLGFPVTWILEFLHFPEIHLSLTDSISELKGTQRLVKHVLESPKRDLNIERIRLKKYFLKKNVTAP